MAEQIFPWIPDALTNGTAGSALAQSIWDSPFRNNLSILHGYGPEGLLSILKLHPNYQTALAPQEAQVQALIADFWGWAHEQLRPEDGWPGEEKPARKKGGQK